MDRCPCCGFRPRKGPFHVDLDTNTFHYDGRTAKLSAMEAEVAYAIIATWPRHQTNERVVTMVWPHNEGDALNYVSVYVWKLKAKLKPLGLTIQTVWGKGYSIKESA
jgi:DNA-binding response OmpR family regulator